MRYALTISISAMVLMLGLAAPASAEDRADPFAGVETLLDPKVLLQGVLREEDVSLLIAQLRAALLASYQGREAPAAEDLNRRLEAIGGEMKAHGAVAGLVLLTAFEAAARQALREALALPPPR